MEEDRQEPGWLSARMVEEGCGDVLIGVEAMPTTKVALATVQYRAMQN